MGIMNHGVIEQVGEPSSVFRKPRNKFVADFLGAANLFPGHAEMAGGISSIDIGGVTIESSAAVTGKVYASIRPEDILLSRKALNSSAVNSFHGSIRKVEDHGSLLQITVDAGVDFVVSITRRSFTDMNLGTGSPVYLTFKATEMHAF